MTEKSEKCHVSLVVVGHVDSGKSTVTGHFIFELGGIAPREMEKLRQEAEVLGKASFAFAFYMDRQKDERARGVTISCTTKEFFTENYHYTIIDAPGHRDFIKNMITGSAQADVCVLLCPADGNFATATCKGDHKIGQPQGQARMHSRLINLLGVKQLIVAVNKMDCDTAAYGKPRYDEIAAEMKDLLYKTGWKKEFVDNSVPIIPLSGWTGENLIKPSDKMPWWTGCKVTTMKGKTVQVHTLLDACDKFIEVPDRKIDAPLRMPLSGLYKIAGVGSVAAGRVEQGVCEANKDCVFIPTHTTANPCTGKIFSLEMHHKKIEKALPGDNVGACIKGLDKNNMPRTGDVIIYKDDKSFPHVKSFVAQVQTLDIVNECKVGYTPVCFIRTGRAACKMTKINWKVGKETNRKKVESPHSLKANEAAEVIFEPNQPLAVASFADCEGLGRCAFLDGNACIMLGKVVGIEAK